MKNTLLASISAVSLAIALNATAQDILWQTPKGEYIIPGDNDRINAFNFLNPEGAAFIFEDPNGILPFNTYYTTNFVNRGTMIGVPGFDFSMFNPTNAFLDGQASSFANVGGGASGGVVECTSLFTTVVSIGIAGGNLTGTIGMPASTGKILVSANEITNSGDFLGDPYSLVRLVGNDVDLSQGTIDLTQGNLSLGGTNVFLTSVQSGWLDEYWGLGTGNTNTMVPAALFFNGTAQTPGAASQVRATNRNFQTVFGSILETNATAYSTTWQFNPSNFLFQTVFLQEPNPAFNMTVGFDPLNGIYVQWQWSSTNIVTGAVNPNNFLTLNDNFGEVTNLQVVVDGTAGPNFTFKPFNYTFAFQPLPAFVFTNGPSIPSLPGFVVTNESTSYEALFTPLPQLVTDLPEFGNATNLPGRIEIECANLRMTNSLMAAPSYTLLKGTNHLFDYPGIGISSPFVDLNLRRTNGSFVVSNLVAAYINHLSGPVQLWSARWTNIDASGVTNQFHVLFVNSSMSTVTPPTIQTLNLTSTNASVANSPGAIVISDILNVTSNLTLNGRSLTITTNAPGAVPSSGQLNLLNANGLFPESTPNLLFLTNRGIITSGNTIDFAGLPFDRTSPDTAPAYAAFVNHGQITDLGSSIFAKYFEHSGILSAMLGSVNFEEGITGFVTNGTILTTFGGISLSCDNLLISNSLFASDGAISLTSSNILTDGVLSLALLPLTNQLTATVTNGNSWSSSGGLVLNVKPATGGDLLGTTISCNADANRQVPIVWAGEDRGVGSFVGNTTTGFFNNSAVGRLILDGKTASSRFNVAGPDTAKNYALYVDYLELRDWATNTDSKGNFTAFHFEPNMKIYFSQAVANGYSIAEKLAGLFATNPPNGGHFVWVSNYNYGYFSSTNITYPGGVVHRVNAALAQSTDLNTPFPPTPVWAPAGSNVPLFPDQPFFVTDVIQLGVVNTNETFSGTLVNFAFDLPGNSGLTFSRSGDGAAWLNVAPNGTLSGTPTSDDVGTNNFTVVVTSASGLSATSTAYITVTTNATAPAEPGSGPAIDSPALSADSSSTSAGAYYGLASDSSNGVSVASSGYVTINVTTRSNYTAKLQLAGHTYSFSGSLKNGVSMSTSSGNSGPLLRLRLQQSGPDQIHGSVSNGAARWSADLVADRLVFNKVKNPANSANYTMIIPPQPNSANGPGGYGNGTVKVDASGKVQWAGTLADGTKVTQGTALSKDGYWPLYSSLYGSRGEVIGWMQITNETGSDMNGTVVWIKPKGTIVKAYSGNFTNCVQASGMVYKADARSSVLNLSDGSVTLTGGALGTNAVICPFTLDTRNHVGGMSRMKMLIKPGNGLITGSAVDPVHGKLSFQGVVLQGSTNGFGFFLNSGESGQVELSPAQ